MNGPFDMSATKYYKGANHMMNIHDIDDIRLRDIITEFVVFDRTNT
jgi:hypothetical protein